MEAIHSAPALAPGTAPSTPQINRSRSSTGNNYPHFSRVFSAQHFDDASNYHGGDLDPYTPNYDNETETSEELRKERDEEAIERGEVEVDEVRMGIRDTRDLGSSLEKKQTTRSFKDPNLVSWDGPDDPANPKNWSFKMKWAATIVVSSFTFISPVSSSMVAPALGTIAFEFGITNKVESQLVLSIFVLAYAIGPLFLGPLSEIYGRVPVLQLANLFYLMYVFSELFIPLHCGF